MKRCRHTRLAVDERALVDAEQRLVERLGELDRVRPQRRRWDDRRHAVAAHGIERNGKHVRGQKVHVGVEDDCVEDPVTHEQLEHIRPRAHGNRRDLGHRCLRFDVEARGLTNLGNLGKRNNDLDFAVVGDRVHAEQPRGDVQLARALELPVEQRALLLHKQRLAHVERKRRAEPK
eukprot:Amastigsp_a340141_25.p3 type:complete len:176 gc:universal Amastigsp_a340141_25:1174-647(-)